MLTKLKERSVNFLILICPVVLPTLVIMGSYISHAPIY